MPWRRQRTLRPAMLIESMLKNLTSGSFAPCTFSSTLVALGPWIWKR